MDKARAESFSDGVFAFAITLLVLGIRIPDLKTGSNQELREALIRTLPQLVPYVTSFATIGIIWLNHHAMFHGLERVEHTDADIEPIAFPLVVAFSPYPTSVLSRYGALPTSAFLYGAVLTFLGITYSLLGWHIARRGLSSSASDKTDTRRKIRRNLTGPLVYFAATLIALVYPKVSVLIYFSVGGLLHFIPTWHLARVPGAMIVHQHRTIPVAHCAEPDARRNKLDFQGAAMGGRIEVSQMYWF